MQRDAQELEEQARLLDGGHVRLKDEAERLTRQKSEQEALASQLVERASMLESQQAMLAAIRSKMDRLKEELRQQAQQLAEDPWSFGPGAAVPDYYGAGIWIGGVDRGESRRRDART